MMAETSIRGVLRKFGKPPQHVHWQDNLRPAPKLTNGSDDREIPRGQPKPWHSQQGRDKKKETTEYQNQRQSKRQRYRAVNRQSRPVEATNIPFHESPDYGKVPQWETREPMPLSVMERVAVVKNAMYDTFLRNTTNRLQDDLRNTMKVYNSEKHELTLQLASLRDTSDGSNASVADDSLETFSQDTSSSPKRSSYFRAPNIVATTSSRSAKGEQTAQKKWKEKKETDRLRTDKDLLKLPVIHSASSKRSQWESGLNMSKPPEVSSQVEPLPGITAARELLEEGMKMPTIYDPERTDAAFDTTKSLRKKVSFADEKRKSLHQVSEIEPRQISPMDSKKRLFPKIVSKKGQSRPAKRPQKRHHLPPLELSLREVRDNPKQVTNTVNEWKSIYSNILDPEVRTKALSDILYAVRLKKLENEQQMKYGDSPRPIKPDSTLCDYTHLNNDRIEYRTESGHRRRGCIPKNTEARLGRKSNAIQLQNYLRKMSRSRRMIEHLEAEEYRLAHISGHKALQEVTQTPVPV